MSENIDLEKLEKKSWRSTFQDGLWDIYLGLIFMGFGIYTIGQLFGSFNALNAILIIAIWDFSAFFFFFIGKKRITQPRMGFVKFGKKRKKKKMKLTIFLFFMVGINVLFLFLPLSGFDLTLSPLIFFLLIGLVFITLPLCVVAYFLEFDRLYLMAFMGGLGLSISELLRPIVDVPLHLLLTYCPIGGIIVVWGTVFLIRFIKKYPLPKGEQLQEVTDG
ncbi:MAG: hypothetical protein ACW986_19305 [Promethearchaeota archaeon]|jgi:hypothetical protein